MYRRLEKSGLGSSPRNSSQMRYAEGISGTSVWVLLVSLSNCWQNLKIELPQTGFRCACLIFGHTDNLTHRTKSFFFFWWLHLWSSTSVLCLYSKVWCDRIPLTYVNVSGQQREHYTLMSAENNSGPRYYSYLTSFVSRKECRGIVKSAVDPKWSWILRN